MISLRFIAIILHVFMRFISVEYLIDWWLLLDNETCTYFISIDLLKDPLNPSAINSLFHSSDVTHPIPRTHKFSKVRKYYVSNEFDKNIAILMIFINRSTFISFYKPGSFIQIERWKENLMDSFSWHVLPLLF